MYCSYHSNQRFSLLFHQGVDDENKRVVSSEKVLNVAFGREVADELPRVSVAALKEGLSHDTGSRILAVAMDALTHFQEQGLESAGAKVTGVPSVKAAKQAWDETSLRFTCRKSVMAEMSPEFSWEKQEAKHEDILRRNLKQKNTSLSFQVQVMQQEAQVCIGNVEEPYIIRPTLVQSTSAADLQRPVNKLGLFKSITEGAHEDDFLAYCLHSDSLASNKLVITDFSEKFPDVCVADMHCIGRFLLLN